MQEDIPLLGRWIARAIQKYWRVVRGLHLTVEACVIDEAGRILMILNENGGSWELPQGIVHKSETLEAALRRVLHDIAGIEVNAKPELAFFYARGKDRQTGLCLVRHWRRLSASSSRGMSFFPAGALPAGAPPQAAERIRRSLEDRTNSEV